MFWVKFWKVFKNLFSILVLNFSGNPTPSTPHQMNNNIVYKICIATASRSNKFIVKPSQFSRLWMEGIKSNRMVETEDQQTVNRQRVNCKVHSKLL